jgi:hypothetical protein
LKDFLKRLELDQLLTERGGNLQEARMKKQHCERLKKDLVEAVRKFEMVSGRVLHRWAGDGRCSGFCERCGRFRMLSDLVKLRLRLRLR